MPGGSGFRIHLLGPFAVFGAGVRLADQEIGSRKGRTLLKLLLVERDHVVSPDRIAEVLWGDSPPPRWERDVATMVSRLRSVLGREAIAGGAGGYRFARSDRFEIDLEQAERFVAESERRLSGGELSLAKAAADRALDLFAAGPLLEEEPFAEWASEPRAAAARLLRRARRCAWRAAFELSDVDGAAAAAEAAIADNALDEDAHRALMLALHRGGRSGQALEAYERVRKILAEEIGTDPDPETKALHLAILREEPIEQAGPPKERPSPVDEPDPSFVGREKELASLARSWRDAVAGQPSLQLIVGEAGIGKTRLAGEVVPLVERTGGRVAQARCYEAERSLFLQPFADAIRSIVLSTPPDVVRAVAGEWDGTLAELVPEVGKILRPLAYQRATPEIERRRSFEAVTAFLRSLCERQPVVLIVDDLHNAGASSLELLHFLLRRSAAARLLVIGTVRLEEGEEALAHLQDVARRTDIGPLPEEAVSSLAHRMGAGELADRILHLTRGHPLFVVETLRALLEGGMPLPGSLVSAVESRVKRTGAPVEEFLRVGAVLGASFDLGIAARMVDIPVEEAARRAEQARRARLLVEAGSDFEFANDLIKEILYQTTPLPVRTPRHRRAASLLADQPEAAAAHASAAGDWHDAMEGWLRAAERAMARYGNRDAEGLLDRALHAATMVGDPAGQARVRVARGRVREALAEYGGAFEDQGTAVQLARSAGEAGLEMLALRELGGDLLIGIGRHIAECVPYLEGALAISRDIADRAAEVDVLSRLAVLWTNRARFDLAFEYVRQAVALARELGDDRALAMALDGLKTAAAYCGDLATLQRVLPELEAILRRTGQLLHLQWAMFESAFPAMARGDWPRAVDRIEQAIALSKKVGSHAYQPLFVAHLGWINRSRGQYGAALAKGHEAVAMADEVGHPWWTAFAEAMLGWTLTEVGAFDEAALHLERGLVAAERDGAESYLVRCLAHLALARWLGGDRGVAVAYLERAEEMLGGIGVPPGMAFLHGAHATIAAGQVRLELMSPGAVESQVAPLHTVAAAMEWTEAQADAALLLARCRRAQGSVEEARGLLAEALGVAEGTTLPRVAWEAHACLAAVLSDQGRSAEADRHLGAARKLVDELSASLEDSRTRLRYRRAARTRLERLAAGKVGAIRPAGR